MEWDRKSWPMKKCKFNKSNEWVYVGKMDARTFGRTDHFELRICVRFLNGSRKRKHLMKFSFRIQCIHRPERCCHEAFAIDQKLAERIIHHLHFTKYRLKHIDKVSGDPNWFTFSWNANLPTFYEKCKQTNDRTHNLPLTVRLTCFTSSHKYLHRLKAIQMTLSYGLASTQTRLTPDIFRAIRFVFVFFVLSFLHWNLHSSIRFPRHCWCWRRRQRRSVIKKFFDAERLSACKMHKSFKS